MIDYIEREVAIGKQNKGAPMTGAATADRRLARQRPNDAGET